MKEILKTTDELRLDMQFYVTCCKQWLRDITSLLSLPLDAGLLQENRKYLESIITPVNDAIFAMENVQEATDELQRKICAGNVYLSIDDMIDAKTENRFWQLTPAGELQEVALEDMPASFIDEAQDKREGTAKSRLESVQVSAERLYQRQVDDERWSKLHHEN